MIMIARLVSIRGYVAKLPYLTLEGDLSLSLHLSGSLNNDIVSDLKAFVSSSLFHIYSGRSVMYFTSRSSEGISEPSDSHSQIS